MGKPKGTKNIMRALEEKEKILHEYLVDYISLEIISKERNIDLSLLKRWKKKYLEYGINGLKSNSGYHRKEKVIRLKNREEELELKIMKLEIENDRLKKGDIVKGGEAQKKYVTTSDENMK